MQAADEVDRVVDPTLAEPAEVQALRAHVRTLETALEDQSDRLEQVQQQLRESNRRHGADLARVALVLNALRERVSGDPDSESMLDRVEAAVSRLAPTSALRRPALPAVARRAAVPAPAALPAVPDPAPAPPPVAVPPPQGVTPPPTAPPEPAAEPVPDAPDPSSPAPTPPDTTEPPTEVAPVPEERVLPVPAPPVQPEPTVGSRWRRRGSA